MQKIYILPEHIVSQIAAGEIIERPAYAVKELIDNAIDAHATSIRIEIEQIGLRKITVIDNGEGMSREDLLLCFKPHTTSKLGPENELIGITSLGFRGEALASITAISDVTIKSKTATDIAGHSLTIIRNEVQDIIPVGMPTGTVVTIDNIFSTIPARKKFIKSEKTELRHVIEILTNFAIAYPFISFTLLHNKKTLLDLPKSPNADIRVQLLLGQDMYQHLVKVTHEDSYLITSGYIAKPHFTTHHPVKQFIFVNNRRVSSKTLTTAVREAYGTLIDQDAHPVFVLFLTIPHELVDINVHPRKERVAFLNEEVLYKTLVNAITSTLHDNNITFSNISWKLDEARKNALTKTYAGKLLKDHVTNTVTPKRTKTAEVSQLHNIYILTESTAGILFVDQHAAHERILFEQFIQEFSKEKKRKQIPLKVPIMLEFSATDKELLKQYRNQLNKIGVKIKELNGLITIISIPEILKDRDIRSIVSELLEDISTSERLPSTDRLSNQMLSFLACRTAVKAGDTLTRQQQKKLLDELETSPNNATCAHGRPTRITISLVELHRLFGRS